MNERGLVARADANYFDSMRSFAAQMYTGFLDGEPVATSALFMSNHVAGVYNVATQDAYRRRGLGAAMTWQAVHDGANAGCLLASLQASEMGRPVYERMGFRTVTSYKTYLRM